MKKLLSMLTLICFCASCTPSIHKFDPGDPIIDLEKSKANAKVACYKYLATQRVDTSNLSASDKVSMEILAHDEKIIAAVTGKSLDPCDQGTNLNDVLIAEMRGQAETYKSEFHDTVGVLEFLVGGILLEKGLEYVTKSAGTRYEFSSIKGGVNFNQKTFTNSPIQLTKESYNPITTTSTAQ